MTATEDKGDGRFKRLAERTRAIQASICEACHRAGFHDPRCLTGRNERDMAAIIRQGMQA